MVKVSVIVPIFNKEEFLEKSITSLVNQSLEDIEIILVNDGSTDDSLMISQEFAKKDSRIKIINKTKNEGVSLARNIGLKAAKGEYVGFIDPDDWIDDQMFETMYDRCIEDNTSVSMCNYKIISDNTSSIIKLGLDEDVLRNSQIFYEIILNMISKEHIDSNKRAILGSVCRLLIKNETIQDNQLLFRSELKYMEDLIFCMELFFSIDKISIVKEAFYNYYKNTLSATYQYREGKFAAQMHVMNLIESILDNHGYLGESKKRIAIRTVDSALNSISNESFPENNKSFTEKINSIAQITKNLSVKKAVSEMDLSNVSIKKKIAIQSLKKEKNYFLLSYYTFINKLKR